MALNYSIPLGPQWGQGRRELATPGPCQKVTEHRLQSETYCRYLSETTRKGDPETILKERVDMWKEIDGTQLYHLRCLKCISFLKNVSF